MFETAEGFIQTEKDLSFIVCGRKGSDDGVIVKEKTKRVVPSDIKERFINIFDSEYEILEGVN